MKNRPTSITVIGWVLIVAACISVITVLATLDNSAMERHMSFNPIPPELQYAMIFVGLLVTFVCGVGFLLGGNWSRFLYVIWSITGFLASSLLYEPNIALFPSLAFVLVVVFFLFRPKANDFFT